MWVVGLALAALIVAPLAAPAAATTRAQAEKQCRAVLNTFDGEKRRSRTGYSFEQDMAFCIKQKIGRPLTKGESK
jgi:hypothetical protein